MSRTPVRLFAAVLVLLLFLASCGSDEESSDAPSPESGGGDAPIEDTEPTSDDTVSGDSSPTGDPVAEAVELTPTASFSIEGGEMIDTVSLSPDGVTMAVTMQSGLGEPVTIRLYDAQTGEPGAETTFDAVGISRPYWMGDGRLVAASEVDEVWRSWDGETLEAYPTQPLEYECRASAVDRVAGYAYSVLDDDSAVCRTDPATGEMVRSADGVVAEVESLWVSPGSAEVLVVHYPDPDPESSAQLLTLDAADLAPGESVPLGIGDQVRAVGATTWIDYFESRSALLQPGAIPAPDIRDPLRPSTAGTYFVSANGDNDLVYVSAVDGTVVGTTSAAWNPSLFSDWSIDDSVMIRMTLDYQIERYEF